MSTDTDSNEDEAPPCPVCEKKAIRVRQLLAWAALLAKVAAVLGAGALLVQAFTA